MTNHRIVRDRLLTGAGSRWRRLIKVGTEIDRWIVGETLAGLLDDLLRVGTNSIAHRLPAQYFRGLMMVVPTDRGRLLGAKAHAGERVLELSTKLAYSRKRKEKGVKNH